MDMVAAPQALDHTGSSPILRLRNGQHLNVRSSHVVTLLNGADRVAVQSFDALPELSDAQEQGDPCAPPTPSEGMEDPEEESAQVNFNQGDRMTPGQSVRITNLGVENIRILVGNSDDAESVVDSSSGFLLEQPPTGGRVLQSRTNLGNRNYRRPGNSNNTPDNKKENRRAAASKLTPLFRLMVDPVTAQTDLLLRPKPSSNEEILEYLVDKKKQDDLRQSHTSTPTAPRSTSVPQFSSVTSFKNSTTTSSMPLPLSSSSASNSTLTVAISTTSKPTTLVTIISTSTATPLPTATSKPTQDQGGGWDPIFEQKWNKECYLPKPIFLDSLDNYCRWKAGLSEGRCAYYENTRLWCGAVPDSHYVSTATSSTAAPTAIPTSTAPERNPNYVDWRFENGFNDKGGCKDEAIFPIWNQRFCKEYGGEDHRCKYYFLSGRWCGKELGPGDMKR